MAKKLDLTRPKEFLFRYGERVALFTCIGLALLLVLWGLLGASGPGTKSGDPWDKVLKTAATSLRAKMPPAEPPSPEDVIKEVKVPDTGWSPIASNAQPGPYISLGEALDSRRRNPEVLPVLAGDENFQLDFLHRGFLGYEVRNGSVLVVEGDGAAKAGMPGFPGAVQPPNAPNANAAGRTPAHQLKPRRILVVSGIFPMKRQVDEFYKALRYAGVGELRAAKELPRVVGINVIREERAPDGKVTTKDAQKLIYYDFQEDKLTVEPALHKELSEAIYDEANPKSLASVIHVGLVTPLPELPDGMKYPSLRIRGESWPNLDQAAPDGDVKPNQPPKGMMPPIGMKPPPIGGMKPPAIGLPPGMKKMGDNPADGQDQGPEPKTETISLKKFAAIDKDLAKRLGGAYNIFHPFGEIADEKAPEVPAIPLQGVGNPAAAGPTPFGFDAVDGEEANGPEGGKLPPGGMPKGFIPKDKGGMGRPAPAMSKAIHDALVRFVDVDVKAGHTYRYAIQVRLENPNFGKKHDVVQQEWATIKELYSPWTWSKTFTVPGTYHLYAVDQLEVDGMGSKDAKTIKKELKKVDGDHAVVQLHRWFSRGGDQSDYLIGDWAIVERLVVRKGEPIGHAEMIVEVPTWNAARGAFEMKTSVPPAVKNTKTPKHLTGVPLDFVPPVLSPDGKQRIIGPPMLVDFDGGRKPQKIGFPADEATLDLLILTPDGRLTVQSTRADLEAAVDDGTPEGTTRQRRVETWRQRNHATMHGDAGGGNVGRPRPIGGR